MTSKISFYKLMREDLKRKTWLLVLAILVFFVSFPVVTMLMMDQGKRFYHLGGTELQLILKENFLELMGYGNVWMSFITFVGATLCGIFGFSYLYNKKKVDFYHSIPVRREKLFFVSYVNGLIIYVLPYLVSILVCLIMGSGYFSVDSEVLSTTFRMFGVQFLYFLMIYHAAILTTVLAGNMFGCIFLNGIVQLYAIAVYLIYEGYCTFYYQTYYGSGNFLEQVSGFSPLISFINTMTCFMGGDGLYQLHLRDGLVSVKLYLMQTFLVTLFLLAAAAYLYKLRSSEMSGKAIAFPKIQPILRILIVIPSALASGLIFEELTYNGGSGWLYFGILFGALLTHGVIEVLYQSDIRGVFSHKIQLAASIAATIIVMLIFQQDLFGYDRYLPKEGKVVSAAIDIEGISQDAYYRIYLGNRSYFLSMTDYQLEKMELSGEMLPAVSQLMSLGIEQMKNPEELTGDRVRFSVRVRLKNGKEVTRKYFASLEDAYDLLATIFDSQEYKETAFAYFLENMSMPEAVRVYGTLGDITLSKEDGVEFLEIYKKELMELTLDDIRDNPIVGGLEYYIPLDTVGEQRNYIRNLYLYPTMTESFACLERMGVMDKVAFWAKPDAENIEALEIGYDNWAWEDYMEADMKIAATQEATTYAEHNIKITDEAQLQEICEKLYVINNSYYNYLFWGDDIGMDMNVRLKPEFCLKYYDNDDPVYVRVRLGKSEELPKWLQEMILEQIEKQE